MPIFAVIFFEKAHPQAVQRLFDFYAEHCRVSDTIYWIWTEGHRHTTSTVAHQLGLVKDHPDGIPDALGAVFRLNADHEGHADLRFVHWLQEREMLDNWAFFKRLVKRCLLIGIPVTIILAIFVFS